MWEENRWTCVGLGLAYVRVRVFLGLEWWNCSTWAVKEVGLNADEGTCFGYWEV